MLWQVSLTKKKKKVPANRLHYLVIHLRYTCPPLWQLAVAWAFPMKEGCNSTRITLVVLFLHRLSLKGGSSHPYECKQLPYKRMDREVKQLASPWYLRCSSELLTFHWYRLRASKNASFSKAESSEASDKTTLTKPRAVKIAITIILFNMLSMLQGIFVESTLKSIVWHTLHRFLPMQCFVFLVLPFCQTVFFTVLVLWSYELFYTFLTSFLH